MTIVHGDGMHSTTNLALTGFSLPPLHVVTLIVISSSFIDADALTEETLKTQALS